VGLYAAAIALALWYAPAGSALHVVLASLWLIPQTQADLKVGTAARRGPDKNEQEETE